MLQSQEMSEADRRWAASLQKSEAPDCCKDWDNHVERPDLATGVPGLRVRVCSKCMRKHRRMSAAPGRIFEQGSPTQ